MLSYMALVSIQTPVKKQVFLTPKPRRLLFSFPRLFRLYHYVKMWIGPKKREKSLEGKIHYYLLNC